jgi:SAM-dependent methyltransferase
MKISFKFIKKLFYIYKLTAKNYSSLRIYQILGIINHKIKGSCLDAGSRLSDTNVSNYINSDNKIIYLNNYFKKKINIFFDLEKYPNKKIKKFKNVLLFNVLEHCKNYKNCLKNIYSFLSPKGKFFASTPFIYKIHGSPRDYFRFTKELLEEDLREIGFKKIKITVLKGGLFICIYSLYFNLTRFIPLLNIFLLSITLFLDRFIELFSDNYKKIYPIGYFIYAVK